MKLYHKTLSTWIIISFALSHIACHTSTKEKENTNTAHIDSLIGMAKDSISSNPEFSKAKIQIAFNQVKDSIQFYEILNLQTTGFIIEGTFDKVIPSLNRIKNFCSKMPESEKIQKLKAAVYNISGIYYSQIGNLDSAIFYHKKSLDYILIGTYRMQLPDVCINLADNFRFKGDYASAALYYRKAHFYADSLKLSENYDFPVYLGLAQVYLNMRDFNLSDTYFKLCEKIFETEDLKDKFVFCNNRGNYYYYKEDYPHSLSWFIKARELVLKKNHQFAINLCEMNMSDVYLHLEQLDSAQYFADKTWDYFLKIKQLSYLNYLATIKAGISLKKKQPELAYSILKEYSDTTGLEKDALLLRNKILQEYYVQSGDFKKAYAYLSKNVNLENSIHSERVKSRVAELDLRYKQDTSILRRDLQIQLFDRKIDKIQMSRYILILVVLIIIISAVFAYLYYKKRYQMTDLQHRNHITRLKLESARNRVSPHFLFNSLQLIKDEINDKPEAFTRLNAIVSMLRSSLLNIEKPYITLKEELEFVENYLLLQKTRLASDVKSVIKTESEDLLSYKIPAMIIQIPVENAIKHGLSGKESGEKLLDIEAFGRDGILQISISDNGIGRIRSGSQTKISGTGTGLKVISQTIHLLNYKNEHKIEFSLIDLKDEKGENCGTKVIIKIPGDFDYGI